MNEKPPENSNEYLETLEEETEFYESIDPSQPSTSTEIAYEHEKIHYAHQRPMQKNRLRAQRQTSVAIAEAAKKNGMQTVDRFGSSFVVPITMQAHPTQLNDRMLNEKDDILSQHEALPYCGHCHSIIKTWRGFEYHVLKIHLKYRPFRCYHCQKECFYTEEEGRFHLSTSHPNEEITLIKEFDGAKETAARIAFKEIYLMCRDGPEVTRERVFEWEKEAAQQVMKFHYLRFKRPIVVTKKLPTINRETQTEFVQVMVQPIINTHQQQPTHIYHQSVPMYRFQEFHHHQHHHLTQPLQIRSRSTATQHDEDPRDREKRVAALMHAVTSSHD